jgi:Spy/CpxP family protein refolding chaperone
MKNTLIRLAGLGALAGGLIFAQNAATATAPNTGRGMAGHAARRGHFRERMANYLNLTPEQRAQAKQVMAGARQEAAPLRQQMKQNREALAAAIRSGNDAQINQITKSEAPVMAQLAAIRAHSFEKIYATLTPQQKTKVDNLRQWLHAGRRGRPGATLG